MKHDGGWRRRGSRYLFESDWFRLRQDEVTLPSGRDITYTLVEHPGYAMVVPLLDDGRVLLERVYRYTVQETLLECPSGGIERREETEQMEIEFHALDGAVELAVSGGITDAPSALALILAQRKLRVR